MTGQKGSHKRTSLQEVPCTPSGLQWFGESLPAVNGCERRPQTDDPSHAFQGYGSVDAREMPLELDHAGLLALLGVNLANSFSNEIFDSEHSVTMIQP